MKNEREKRYNTREWRILKNKSDMSSKSRISYVDSEADDDYLLKGLNKGAKGDIKHFPKEKQDAIVKQRQMAKEQGAVKYIAPLKGRKV